MSDKIIYSANKIFTGTEWLTDYSIIVEDEIIIDIVPTSSISTSADQQI